MASSTRPSDAYLAAIAIELDALLVTTDRDFARFPGAALAAPARLIRRYRHIWRS